MKDHYTREEVLTALVNLQSILLETGDQLIVDGNDMHIVDVSSGAGVDGEVLFDRGFTPATRD
jgi:hypothetical protein